MDATLKSSAKIYPGTQITTLARLVKGDGSLLSSSDLSSIRLQVFEKGSDSLDAIIIGPLSATGIVVATSSATNTLAIDSGWDADRTGYNFNHTFDTDVFLTGGRNYRAEYRIATSSLGNMFVLVDIEVLSTGQAAS